MFDLCSFGSFNEPSMLLISHLVVHHICAHKKQILDAQQSSTECLFIIVVDMAKSNPAVLKACFVRSFG